MSGAPWGSAGSAQAIPWAYLRLMGAEGLTHMTKVAIVSANHVASRLQDHLSAVVLGDGLVAHECLRSARDHRSTGVTVTTSPNGSSTTGPRTDDVLPVAGTLDGRTHRERGPEPRQVLRRDDRHSLRSTKRARARWRSATASCAMPPHTAQCLVDEWDRPYPRRTAVFFAGADTKYWPPTRRIDNAFGDRNPHCTCAPVSDYSLKAPAAW